jgi:RNA polymerase-binding protein DksA
MFSKEKIEYFKKILEEEKAHLEKDMERVGRRNLNVPGDWEVSPVDLNVEISDPNELADTFEELETRAALEDKLEERLNFVNQALNRIKNGTYGICGKCGKPINIERLKVSPESEFCIDCKKNIWQ